MAGVEEALNDAERRELRAKARAALLTTLRAFGGDALRRPLLEQAREGGGFTARELAAPAPPNGRHTLLVDHELSWSLTNLRRDGLVENPRRSVWALAGAATESVAPPAALSAASEDRLAELRAMPYREYLRTPEWRKTRAAALYRAGAQCAFDPAHTGPHHVHHRTYVNLGAERAEDLLVVCEECHRVHHAHHGQPRAKMRRAARRKAKQKAIVWDAVLRLSLAAGLVVGLLGMLER